MVRLLRIYGNNLNQLARRANEGGSIYRNDVEDLQRDKARLLREKVEFLRSLRQMKQKVQSLYQEVFGRLRDENGRPYSPSQYALQYAGDGSVLLIPRTLADQQARRQERKPKDRRK